MPFQRIVWFISLRTSENNASQVRSLKVLIFLFERVASLKVEIISTSNESSLFSHFSESLTEWGLKRQFFSLHKIIPKKAVKIYSTYHVTNFQY